MPPLRRQSADDCGPAHGSHSDHRGQRGNRGCAEQTAAAAMTPRRGTTLSKMRSHPRNTYRIYPPPHASLPLRCSPRQECRPDEPHTRPYPPAGLRNRGTGTGNVGGRGGVGGGARNATCCCTFLIQSRRTFLELSLGGEDWEHTWKTRCPCRQMSGHGENQWSTGEEGSHGGPVRHAAVGRKTHYVTRLQELSLYSAFLRSTGAHGVPKS